jgi:hypothetical protein
LFCKLQPTRTIHRMGNRICARDTLLRSLRIVRHAVRIPAARKSAALVKMDVGAWLKQIEVQLLRIYLWIPVTNRQNALGSLGVHGTSTITACRYVIRIRR